MKLNILGCHSATPLENAHTTSQVLEIKDHLFLIDCGEGTQVELRRHKIKFVRIKHIFISHLHGDHYFGLVGLFNCSNLRLDLVQMRLACGLHFRFNYRILAIF